MKGISRMTETQVSHAWGVFLEGGECSLNKETWDFPGEGGPSHYLFTVKFSNPKMSRRPMDRREFFTSWEGGL